MPADPWTDAARMAGCFAAVAAVAGPVAWVYRRAGPPPVRRPQSPLTGFDLAIGFFVVMLVVPAAVGLVLDGSKLFGRVYDPEPVEPAVRGLWIGLLSAPFQFALLYAVYLRGSRFGSLAEIRFAVRWWFALTPLVLAVHAGVNAVFTHLGTTPEEHPLTRFGADRPAAERAMFALQAAVVAPLLEELLFRGALLGWLIGGLGRPAERRVWIVLGMAVVVAAVTRPENPLSPAGFAAALVAGWAVLRTRARKRRALGGIYTSAALFAAVHSSVWPTPVPLFVLGLGLGWVAVRTNGVLAPAIVHGLFNTVSVLFVLSGGSK